MNNSILAAAGKRWTKVAMVIAKASKSIYGDLPDGHSPYDAVFKRIEALVSDGRLAARGNIKNWRSSEVRRVTGETEKLPDSPHALSLAPCA